MYVLSAEQIRAWDQYTIQHEPVASIDLMERAARKCVDWLQRNNWQERPFFIFCGKGNNGGDGLAIARMLLQLGFSVNTFILENGKSGSPDFQANLQRLHTRTTDIHFSQPGVSFPKLPDEAIVIDALFGTGLNQPVTGFVAELIQCINTSNATVVSIDLPSGLFADQSSSNTSSIVKADHTLTFQAFKLALLIQENASFVGEVHVIDIGLHPAFLETIHSSFQLMDETWAKRLFCPRNRFAHKGQFGHALVVGGSIGKMGAMLLATKACVAAGAGLTTALVPAAGYEIMQTGVPEAMVITDTQESVLSVLPEDISKYSAIGIGPGMGTSESAMNTFSFICRRYDRPVVIDADGLNALAKQPELLTHLPPFSILTPHPKEFERTFGTQANDFDKLEKAREAASRYKIIIVLKGHHTSISTPGGISFFNTTGNAGLAKGGSGDVLTGIITALLAQGYQPIHAALLGVWLHGAAGDKAMTMKAFETLTATDIIDGLSFAFRRLYPEPLRDGMV